MPQLTKTGIGFILLSLVLYLSSVQTQSGLLFLVIGILFGCFVVNIAESRKSLKLLKFGRFKALRAVEGEPVTMPLEVSNPSRSPAGMVEVNSKYGNLFKLGTIGAKSVYHVSPEISFPRRGIYPFDKLILRSTFPFGLVRAAKYLKQSGEFIVYPKLYPAPCPKASGFEPMVGGSYSGKYKTASGNDFAGVRKYQPGDSVRTIHWKSSSKGRGIMVKEFHEELSGRIGFIVDCSDTEAENGDRILDYAARAAGSLIFSALDHDHYVEMVSLDKLKLFQNPSFSDGEPMLEALARLEEGHDGLNRENLDKAVNLINHKAAVCMVLTRVNEDVNQVIENLHADGRVVTVCLPEGLREMPLPQGVRTLYYGRDFITEEG